MIRSDAGERIRTVRTDAISHLETRHALPEVTILGTEVLYEVLYDETGTHCGARRIEDSEAIEACRSELSDLWNQGEELPTFFDREVKPLPPPRSRS